MLDCKTTRHKKSFIKAICQPARLLIRIHIGVTHWVCVRTAHTTGLNKIYEPTSDVDTLENVKLRSLPFRFATACYRFVAVVFLAALLLVSAVCRGRLFLLARWRKKEKKVTSSCVLSFLQGFYVASGQYVSIALVVARCVTEGEGEGGGGEDLWSYFR